MSDAFPEDDVGTDDYRKVCLFLVNETEKAYCFINDLDNKVKHWLPKSQISHVSKGPPDTNGIRFCQVTAKEWLLDKHHL